MISYSPSEFKNKLDSGRRRRPVVRCKDPSRGKEQGRLPYENQVNIPLGQLRDRANELPTDKK